MIIQPFISKIVTVSDIATINIMTRPAFTTRITYTSADDSGKVITESVSQLAVRDVLTGTLIAVDTDAEITVDEENIIPTGNDGLYLVMGDGIIRADIAAR